jgi:chemotaxis methyl-accepting protein methylase
MALLQDLLISVTNFFRDQEAFQAVQSELSKLFADKNSDHQVRVWVPGCATGEEAYSIAMVLSEYASRLSAPPQIQVFATDLDQGSINVARAGFYPDTITADVSEERLRVFFTKESAGYRVRRGMRETVLFALHDLLKDRPFSRTDLISCRNLLIYLDREAQRRAFEIFHFALLEKGMLFLGSSESIEDAGLLFTTLDKKKAAENCGVLFCVEVVNRLEHYMLNTAEEGVACAKQVGSPNCKLLLDTFHMNIEEESLRGALVETGDLLGHFHLGETNRRPPGTGRMPWPEIFGSLREINYQGAVTMEPFLLPGGEVGRDVSVYRVLPGADNRDEEATRSVQFVRSEMSKVAG